MGMIPFGRRGGSSGTDGGNGGMGKGIIGGIEL